MPTETEQKVVRLHDALRRLLDAHKGLIKDTNSEPLFGELDSVIDAEAALFANRPLADWEPLPTKTEIMDLHDRTMAALTDRKGGVE